ncbi:MAG: bifunctional oligoribonuclease/PAP phosphatase NrnA [Clostridia bacterium]
MIKKLITAINNSTKIALISHISPDGDTCGSALALLRALELFGKSPSIFCENTLSKNLKTLKFSEKYCQESNEIFDLAIAVDCADFSRMGACSNIFQRARHTVNIDHHKTNDNYAEINIVEGGVSATAEVAFKIISALNDIKNCMDDDVARLLYTALVTDSGGFTFSSVSSQTHDIASKLIKFDINASAICEVFLKNITYNVFTLKNLVLSGAKFFDNNKIGFIYFSKENFEKTNTDDECTTGIINNIRNVEGVKIAVSIVETDTPNSYKVSIRTADSVDASRIAMYFGGGGHKNASGCRVSGFFEDVKDKLLKVCRDYLV